MPIRPCWKLQMHTVLNGSISNGNTDAFDLVVPRIQAIKK
jgi:hypothetical protein